MEVSTGSITRTVMRLYTVGLDGCKEEIIVLSPSCLWSFG